MMRNLTFIFLVVLLLVCPLNTHAWDGFDYDSGDYIEIENPKSVIPGLDITIYDYSDESDHDVSVLSVAQNGSVTIEVFDHDTGDYRTFEMDDESKGQKSMPPNAL